MQVFPIQQSKQKLFRTTPPLSFVLLDNGLPIIIMSLYFIPCLSFEIFSTLSNYLNLFHSLKLSLQLLFFLPQPPNVSYPLLPFQFLYPKFGYVTLPRLQYFNNS